TAQQLPLLLRRARGPCKGPAFWSRLPARLLSPQCGTALLPLLARALCTYTHAHAHTHTHTHTHTHNKHTHTHTQKHKGTQEHLTQRGNSRTEKKMRKTQPFTSAPM